MVHPAEIPVKGAGLPPLIGTLQRPHQIGKDPVHGGGGAVSERRFSPPGRPFPAEVIPEKQGLPGRKHPVLRMALDDPGIGVLAEIVRSDHERAEDPPRPLVLPRRTLREQADRIRLQFLRRLRLPPGGAAQIPPRRDGERFADPLRILRRNVEGRVGVGRDRIVEQPVPAFLPGLLQPALPGERLFPLRDQSRDGVLDPRIGEGQMLRKRVGIDEALLPPESGPRSWRPCAP